jgi:hypothetical protein
MSHGDNDNDGLWNEDLPDGLDNDNDGLIDEDAYGLMTRLDDDRDGAVDEDPPDGVDNDNDGLIDKDGPPLQEGPDSAITSWIRPIRLDSTRNLATLVNERYLLGELGGATPGKASQNPFMVIPSEVGFRREAADPVSSDNFGPSSKRSDFGNMVDGNIFTSLGAADNRNRTPSFNFKGYYYINRIMFRPRPTVPNSTPANYIVQYGNQNSINDRTEGIRADRVFWPVVRGQANPVVKNLVLDEPLVVGRLDINSRDPAQIFIETAEAQVFGEGYPVDANFTSEMIDVGTPTPRVRRYSREIEQFSNSERNLYEGEFPDRPGGLVNWGKVRWRGRLDGDDGDVRIQFRAGNSLDTHIYERRLAAALPIRAT